MAEYIDREALYNALFALNGKNGQGWDMVEALELVENFPTADVAPVIHAHWTTEVVAKETVYGTDMVTRAVCGKCKHKFFVAAKTYLFCPDCGAKMDARKEGSAP